MEQKLVFGIPTDGGIHGLGWRLFITKSRPEPEPEPEGRKALPSWEYIEKPLSWQTRLEGAKHTPNTDWYVGGEGGVDARCAATIPKSKGRGRSLVLGAEEREGVRNARPLNGVAVVCRYRGYVRARALVQLPGYLNLRRAIGQDRACAGQRWAPPPGPFAPSPPRAPRRST